jgi:hypothetical protein
MLAPISLELNAEAFNKFKGTFSTIFERNNTIFLRNQITSFTHSLISSLKYSEVSRSSRLESLFQYFAMSGPFYEELVTTPVALLQLEHPATFPESSISALEKVHLDFVLILF